MCRSLKYWATVHSTVCPLSCCSGNLGDKEEPVGMAAEAPAPACLGLRPSGRCLGYTAKAPPRGQQHTRPLGHLDRPRPCPATLPAAGK